MKEYRSWVRGKEIPEVEADIKVATDWLSNRRKRGTVKAKSKEFINDEGMDEPEDGEAEYIDPNGGSDASDSGEEVAAPAKKAAAVPANKTVAAAAKKPTTAVAVKKGLGVGALPGPAAASSKQATATNSKASGGKAAKSQAAKTKKPGGKPLPVRREQEVCLPLTFY